MGYVCAVLFGMCVMTYILGSGPQLKAAWFTFPFRRANRIAAADEAANHLLALQDRDFAIEMGYMETYAFHMEPEEELKRAETVEMGFSRR